MEHRIQTKNLPSAWIVYFSLLILSSWIATNYLQRTHSLGEIKIYEKLWPSEITEHNENMEKANDNLSRSVLAKKTKW